MVDQYIREYWGDPEQSDKLIQFYKEADRLGFTKEGRVGSIDCPEGRPEPEKKRSTEMPFEDIWNGEMGEDVWGLRNYMDFITDCYSDYWEHFKLPPPVGIKILPQIQYYKPGEGYYFPHIDAESTVMSRVLVYISYLNDVPDGGTIMVNNDGFTIHAEKHKHVGEISKTHEKYICTGWVEWLPVQG